MYNDKGYVWSNHTPDQSEHLRRQWLEELVQVFGQLEQRDAPAALAQAVKSGEAVTDSSGQYVEIACAWLGLPHPAEAMRAKYMQC